MGMPQKGENTGLAHRRRLPSTKVRQHHRNVRLLVHVGRPHHGQNADSHALQWKNQREQPCQHLANGTTGEDSNVEGHGVWTCGIAFVTH